MLFINEIPDLKIYKLGVLLPEDKNDPNKNNIIIMNNPISGELSGILNNRLIKHRNRYKNYYIDFRYFEKIGTKQIRLDYKVDRALLYKKISSTYGLQTPMRLDIIKNKNLYYDISVYNQIFFKYITVPSMQRKIEEYIKFFNKIMHNPVIESYNTKTVIIDIDAWMKFDRIHNPIIYIYTAYKKYYNVFTSIGDINIILYNNDCVFKFNPFRCGEKDFQTFKNRLDTILKNINLDNDMEFEKELAKSELKEKISTSVHYNFTGNKDTTSDISDIDNSDENIIDINSEELSKKDDEDKISEKIADKNIDKIEVLKKESEDIKKDLAIDEDDVINIDEFDIEIDKDTMAELYELQQRKVTGKTTASLKRDEELRKRQKEIKLEGKTLAQLTSMNNDKPLPVTNISSKVTTTNKNVTNIRFNSFEKEYNEKLLKSDIIKNIEALNNKSIPVFITNIDIRDNSDELNYMDTWTIKLEDGNRIRHTITVDIPKFIDNKFLYIDGNKKIINKQLFMKPICKTGPDTVKVSTNYNRIFITRYGGKLSSRVERLKKALSVNNPKVKISYGNAEQVNFNHNTTLEYDEISKTINSIKSNGNEIIFNQKEIHEKLGDTKVPEGKICIGFYKNNQPIYMDYKTEKIGDLDMVDYIISIMDTSFQKTYEETQITTKKFMYSRATVMAKKVPIILLVGYCEGLSTVLKKANIKHYFSDKRPRVDDKETVVEFSDGYLVFDKYPIENSLLLNALLYLPTKSYSYSDFDDKNTYVELFDVLYGARNLANAFDTFYEFMIDEITKEVLIELDYPTDFVSVILTANALLGDNKFIKENNMNLYRIRSNEVISAIFYKQLASAYSKYKSTAYNKYPIKISMPRNIVIKELVALQTVEPIATLNPIHELEKTRAITYKGLDGLNVSEAYTQDKRAYDKSMAGILAINTSPDANVNYCVV